MLCTIKSAFGWQYLEIINVIGNYYLGNKLFGIFFKEEVIAPTLPNKVHWLPKMGCSKGLKLVSKGYWWLMEEGWTGTYEFSCIAPLGMSKAE